MANATNKKPPRSNKSSLSSWVAVGAANEITADIGSLTRDQPMSVCRAAAVTATQRAAS
jgi:hypothetical protein